jgi:alcohol dehydrogenase (cytochrome c)/quinohemoprotein ethanol dehydrogenase
LSPTRDPANAKTVADAAKSSHGAFLIAWDPVQQREAWRIAYPHAGNGGTLATGGKLVFQGSVDGFLNAYAADTGAKLWSYDAQNAIMGGPITYELDGEQYVATLAGLGGVSMSGALAGGARQRSEYGRVVAFKLGGKSELPALQERVSRLIPDLKRANPTGDVEAGQRNYDRVCSACHGAGARSATSVPDLRYSPAIADAATFRSIVIDGVRAQQGMVGFGSVLTPADAEAVRAYLVHMALATEEAR